MDPKEFLESGLLFEINRQVLHPLGLAMSVTVCEDGDVILNQVIQKSPDLDGFVYDAETYKEGNLKLQAFLLRDENKKRRVARKVLFPKMIQTKPKKVNP